MPRRRKDAFSGVHEKVMETYLVFQTEEPSHRITISVLGDIIGVNVTFKVGWMKFTTQHGLDKRVHKIL